MIITAVLTMILLWLLFYGTLPNLLLLAVCILTGGFLAIISRHKHDGFLMIDVIAQKSRLHPVNPFLKFWTVLVLMILCISSKNPMTGIFLTLAMLIITVAAGGLELHSYLSLLSLPVSFLLLSGLALLFEYSSQSVGLINLPVLHGYLSVSRPAQVQASLVISRALGAISCLYLLSLSTPMSEIIGVLRRLHIPEVITELMYLIYRYTFILLEMYHSMKNAAQSRLGYISFPVSVRTTGSIYSNLLVRSFRQANKNFDAMESRCFQGEIRFLENRKKISWLHAAASVLLILFTFLLSIH